MTLKVERSGGIMDRNKTNDTDRRQWIDNDEYLYNEARRYKGGIAAYIRDHRQEIDAIISATLGGDRQPHEGPSGQYIR